MQNILNTPALDAARIADAYRGLSWTPDRTAAVYQAEYVEHMNAFAARYEPLADTPDRRNDLAVDLENYRARWVGHLYAYIDALGRCMSAAVTGPSNFPAERNAKRLATADKRRQEWIDWQAKMAKWFAAKWQPSGRAPIRSGDPDAIAKLEVKVEAARRDAARWKAANKIVRNAKLDAPAKVKKLVDDLAYKPAEAAALVAPPAHLAYQGPGYPAYVFQNHNANIRRMLKRIEEIKALQAKPAGAWTFDGGRIEENADTNRVEIFFDAKPDEAMCDRLKAHSFRWTPSITAWTRQRNASALYWAGAICGVDTSRPDNACGIAGVDPQEQPPAADALQVYPPPQYVEEMLAAAD